MLISTHDRSVLRRLAERQAQVAALPVHAHTIAGWKRINSLRPHKPMVWINEICWHELRNEAELRLECEDRFCRGVEEDLRRRLYQWDHLRADMVVEDVYHCPLAIRDSGFGIAEDVDIVRTDDASSVVSRHFRTQIQGEADAAKIRMPVIEHDRADSDRRFEILAQAFGDMLRIERRGIAGLWFAPWDELVRWWAPEDSMIALAESPQVVHAIMERLVSAYLCRLDQYEQLGLLSPNNTNVRIGSGGLGYCDELPGDDFDPAHVRTRNQWGSATAQIFSEVSPAMHEKFALAYERRWLDRFALTYYGCCEPLHLKLGILESVKNLRKVSMSPRADLDKAVPQIGQRYVISHKPNPAVLADDVWDVERARMQLRRALEQTRGCIVEVILKDISTIRYEPRRLWDWAAMAAEETQRFA